MCENADEDRRARRRKLGLPEELTEEEKAQEAAAAAQKAEAAKKKGSFVTVKPVSGVPLLSGCSCRSACVAVHQERKAYAGGSRVISH